MKWNGMKRIILKYSSLPFFGSFNGENGKSISGRVNGTFTSKAYDEIVKELAEKFDMEINKDKVKKRQKTLKKNFYECYDIFKDGLSGFGWNDSLNMWTAEPEVWEPLIVVNYHFL